MPLIVISGGPCSGKSTRAQVLYDYFQSKSMPVHLITDNQLEKNTVYAGSSSRRKAMDIVFSHLDNTLEKQARSDLKAETQR